MRIETKLSEILRFVQTDCQIHGRGRKKWWADQIGIAPMMLSHWLAGRRSPSAGHLNDIYFITEEIKAESQKADFSEFLWRNYYDNSVIDPYILRSVAERLLLSKGLNSRLLALLSWLFEEFSPRPYEFAELPLSALWQNRLGWLYESAGLNPGFEPRHFGQTRSLLEIGPTDFGNRLDKYLIRKQTSLGKRWDLYDCPLNELKEQFNWRRSSRPVELGLHKLEIRVADPYDIVLGKLARLEPKDIEDILALTQAGHIEVDTLLDRLNDNLAEVKKFSHYRKNASLLFGEILERPIVFKQGRARFV